VKRLLIADSESYAQKKPDAAEHKIDLAWVGYRLVLRRHHRFFALYIEHAKPV
jgi:hypothetical protein